jgi:hypothetical protein
MIPLDEEELNSEHEVKQAGPAAASSVRTWYKDENSPKQQIQYRAECLQFIEATNWNLPTKPLGNLYSCPSCRSGLLATDNPASYRKLSTRSDCRGGIGGAAVGLFAAGYRLRFTNATWILKRSQGYGLTLQQASKAIKGLGIHFDKGVVSPNILCIQPKGQFRRMGMRKWMSDDSKKVQPYQYSYYPQTTFGNLRRVERVEHDLKNL